MLFETFEIPTQDTIKWQQLQTEDNYFDENTTHATTELGVNGFEPIQKSAQSLQMMPQTLKEKKLMASCMRCQRAISEDEMTTIGYLNCIECQMFTCRSCAPLPTP